jgi:hypothetical protein
MSTVVLRQVAAAPTGPVRLAQQAEAILRARVRL